jgi:hypothetical protein
MAIPDNTHKLVCDALAAVCGYVSIHEGPAGTTGANEAAGGGYARQLTTYATGGMSGGLWVREGTEVEVPVDEGDYEEAGFYDAATAGNFRGSDVFLGGTISVIGTGISIRITPYMQA